MPGLSLNDFWVYISVEIVCYDFFISLNFDVVLLYMKSEQDRIILLNILIKYFSKLFKK